MTPTVSTELSLSLVVPGDEPLPVEASATYAMSDPYAVRLDISTGPDSAVTWHFSRELLTAGVADFCGEGDVRIEPVESGAGRMVRITLSSPDGIASLEAPLAQVTEFLTETYVLVPTGCESDFVDLDREISMLLSD
jgi:Streptomyces sporulation and cell division protein, SsgA